MFEKETYESKKSKEVVEDLCFKLYEIEEMEMIKFIKWQMVNIKLLVE